MKDHPYAGGNTLEPGEVADDDPCSETVECRECDDFVVPIPGVGKCPGCGKELT